MGRFVKKGQRVVIKANIAWARTPEQACTNNPELLSALIKMCYDAGAKRVAVWDHTCDNYQFTFSRSGLKETAQKAGQISSQAMVTMSTNRWKSQRERN
jgi:uncharacterized protein (DUF362 family)